MRVLDNFSTGSRANLAGLEQRRRARRGRPSLVRARPRSRARRRGRLPPGRAPLGAALGPGSADDDRGQHRGHAQRPPRRARRGRAPHRQRVVVVGVRERRRAAARRDAGARPDLAVRASRSSPPSASARASAASTAWRSSSLRYFNVFGPRQDPTSQYAAVVPRFIRAIADGEPVTIYGDGEQSRDFTFVDNVVAANLLAADAAGRRRRDPQRRDGRLGDRQRARGRDRRAPRQAGREGVSSRRATATSTRRGRTSSEAQRLLGYEPQVDFDEGLRRTADYLLEERTEPWDTHSARSTSSARATASARSASRSA